MKGVETVEIEVVRLAHAHDLALPDYATAAAAGADLLAAIDQDIELGAAGTQDRADRHLDRPTGRLRGPGPAALGPGGQEWRDGGQRAGNRRC